MALDWTLTAAVGLMVGISVGILIELKYVVKMDRKITHLLERVARIELRTEHELLKAIRAKKIGPRKVRKAKPKRKKTKRKR